MLEKIIVGCTEGLYYMHSKGFVHCDVKPDNFLVSREGEVKLIDFTISQKMKTGIAGCLAARPKTYKDVELHVAGANTWRGIGPTLGRVQFWLRYVRVVTGKPPYTGTSPNELLNKHISASIPRRWWPTKM